MPSHRAAYRFYRRLTFQTWLLSTKMVQQSPGYVRNLNLSC